MHLHHSTSVEGLRFGAGYLRDRRRAVTRVADPGLRSDVPRGGRSQSHRRMIDHGALVHERWAHEFRHAAGSRNGCVQSVFAASHRGHHHGGKISGGSRWSMRAVGTRPVPRRRGSSRIGCGIRGSSRVPRPRRGGSSCAGPAGPTGAGGTGARLAGPARGRSDRSRPDPAGSSALALEPVRGARDRGPAVAADWAARPSLVRLASCPLNS